MVVELVDGVVGQGELLGPEGEPEPVDDALRHQIRGRSRTGQPFVLAMLEWPDHEWSVERWVSV